MLEEGQRDDWFGSPFIQTCAVLAGMFVPAFVLIELWRDKPFVNLRLVGSRNLGIASAANFIQGFALYGTVYLLPQYLTVVQGYDAFQTGQTMIWVGLTSTPGFPVCTPFDETIRSARVSLLREPGICCELLAQHLDVT